MPKITISPGQGLLLLMDHYKADESLQTQLKKLYLSGAVSAEDKEAFRRLLSDEILSKYEILFDPKTINDDPTRRYFETHLAYETLKQNLSKIDTDELRSHVTEITEIAPAGGVRDMLMGYVQPIFEGIISSRADEYEIEKATYFARIKESSTFKDLSTEDRTKLELLVKSAVLAVQVMEFTDFPLDIYGSGIFSPEHRGKRMVEEQKSTRSQSFGIMKGHMPLATDDLAFATDITPTMRPADQASFELDSTWVRENFERLVHPFSNSISGTELAQLRVIAKLRNDGHPGFTVSSEKMAQYHQLFISALLFGGGGHTLYEFIAPLTLAEVQKEFETTPGFEHIDLESLFLSGNEAAFDSALQATIDYQKRILAQKSLNLALESKEAKAASPALEQIESKRRLIDLIQTKIDLNREKEEEEETRFSFFCCRVRKPDADPFNYDLPMLLNFIKEDQIPRAQHLITELKTQIQNKFGEHRISGPSLENYKFLDYIEKELIRYSIHIRPEPGHLTRKM